MAKELQEIEKIRMEKMQRKFRDATKLMQSWEVEKKMKLMNQNAERKADRAYHKIVYGGALAEDLLSQTQPKIKSAAHSTAVPSTPIRMYRAKQQEILDHMAFKS